jgi:hypothetical protein
MGMYEILAGTSLTLGLAIPVFMDKVMRPRYEEKINQYNSEKTRQFLETLDDINSTAQENTESIFTDLEPEIDELFNKWGRLKEDENRYEDLLKRRKEIFIIWMITFGLNLLSIEYSNSYLFNTEILIGDTSKLFFSGSFIIGTKYI